MKKIITFVTGIVIIFGISSVTYADVPNNSDTQTITQNTNNTASESNVQTGDTINLTLQDSLNNIEKVNPNIKIEDAKINLLEAQYNDDKEKSSFPDSPDSGSVSNQLQVSWNWKDSLNTLNNEKHNRDEQLKSLKNDLEKQYLNAVSDQQDIESIHAQIDNLAKKIQQTNLKIQMGQSTNTELDGLNAQNATLNTNLNTVQSQLESELLTIKQYLNIDPNKKINLAPAKEDFVKLDENGIDTRLENALNKNYSIQELNNSISLLQDKRTIYSTYYSPGNSDSTIRTLDINIEQAQENIEDTKLATRISLMKSYYDLENKGDTVEAEKLNLEVAQESFDTAQTNFNSGVIGQIDLESARISLEQQKTKFQRAINDYMVTSESFKHTLGEDENVTQTSDTIDGQGTSQLQQ